MEKLKIIDTLQCISDSGKSDSEESQITPINSMDLIRFSPYLGLPYFQRGSVWKDEDKALLLLSLFKRTPCGTIILWKVEDSNKNFGTPLLDKNNYEALFDGQYQKKEIKYWVVDGQQRIRSLISIYGNMLSDNDRRWVVNLRMLPELKNGYFGSVDKESPLFLNISINKKREIANTKYRHNYLSLRGLYEGNIKEEESLIESYDKQKVIDKINEQYLTKDKFNIFHQMFYKKQFGCSIVTDNMPDLVDMYNRINSSGVNVNSEEKAYATLIKLNTDATLKNIKNLFTELQNYDNSDNSSSDDAALDRGKETSFGFKLYIRIFILAAQYHLFPEKKKAYLDVNFNEVQNSKIQSVIVKNQRRIKQIWEETQEIVLLIFSVFNKELHCDDTRFIPNAYSIRLVAYLLLKFKELREHRNAIAYLLAVSYITPLDESKITKLSGEIKDFEELVKILIGDKEELENQVNNFISKSTSINHPAVKLLYWLVRKNEARDFTYGINQHPDNASSNGNNQLPPRELYVCRNSNIQIQHIIPFAKFKGTGISASRSGSSESNSIGNLTMISDKLNLYLKDDFLNLEEEEPNILKQHLLDKNIIDVYKKIKAIMGKESSENIANPYKDFCISRKKYIHKELFKWLTNMYKDIGIIDLSTNKRLVDNNEKLEAICNSLKHNEFDVKNSKLYDENMLQLGRKEWNGYIFYFIRDNQDEENTFNVGLAMIYNVRIKVEGIDEIEGYIKNECGIPEIQSTTEEIKNTQYVTFYLKLGENDIIASLSKLIDNKDLGELLKKNVNISKRKKRSIDDAKNNIREKNLDNLFNYFEDKVRNLLALERGQVSNNTVPYQFKNKKAVVSFIDTESTNCMLLGLTYDAFNKYCKADYPATYYLNHFVQYHIDCPQKENKGIYTRYFMFIQLHNNDDIDNFVKALNAIPVKN